MANESMSESMNRRSIYARSVQMERYLPPFMAQYREMQALMQAENAEFEDLLMYLRCMLDDLFIESASEAALERYERIMGVYPLLGEKTDTRRLRLLLACARARKSSAAALVSAAAVMGEQVEVQILPGHVIVIDFLSGNDANIAVLKKEFAACLPAHMEMVVRNVQKLTGEGFAGGTIGLSMNYCFREV